MKKKFVLVFSLLLALFLCSCGANGQPALSDQFEKGQHQEPVSETLPASRLPEAPSSAELYRYAAEDDYWKNEDISPLYEGIDSIKPFYVATPGDRTEYPVIEESWATEYFDAVLSKIETDTNHIFYPELYFPGGDLFVPDEIVTSKIRLIIYEYNKIIEDPIEVRTDRFPAEKEEEDMWNDEIYCRSILISDLQKVFDFFFGKDRFNVSEWEGDMYFCSEDGFFYFIVFGEGGYYPAYRYGLLSVEYEGEEAILTINQADINTFYELRDGFSDNAIICDIRDDGKYYDSKNLMEGFRDIPINIDKLEALRIRISKKGFPHFVCVEQESPLRYCVVTASPNLRIRENAAPDARILGAVPFGTILRIQDKKDGFSCVTYDRVRGWVSEEYLFDITEHYDIVKEIDAHRMGKDEYFMPKHYVLAVPKGGSGELVVHYTGAPEDIAYTNSDEKVSHIDNYYEKYDYVHFRLHGNEAGTSTYTFSNSKNDSTFEVFVIAA